MAVQLTDEQQARVTKCFEDAYLASTALDGLKLSFRSFDVHQPFSIIGPGEPWNASKAILAMPDHQLTAFLTNMINRIYKRDAELFAPVVEEVPEEILAEGELEAVLEDLEMVVEVDEPNP